MTKDQLKAVIDALFTTLESYFKGRTLLLLALEAARTAAESDAVLTAILGLLGKAGA